MTNENTKSKEISETKKSVHAKMSQIKSELSKCKIPKSGNNKFAGFKYHELQDFMPLVTDLNSKHGINTVTEFSKTDGVCTLKIINSDDKEDFYEIKIPYVEAEMLSKGGGVSNIDAVQRLGSTITYNRRYLFMTAYDITESDSVDAVEPVGKKREPTIPKKPEQQKSQAKPKPSKEVWERALEKLRTGETEKETVLKALDLTDEQIKFINEL